MRRRPRLLAAGVGLLAAMVTALAVWLLLSGTYKASALLHVSFPEPLANSTIRNRPAPGPMVAAGLHSRMVLVRVLAQDGVRRLAPVRTQPDVETAVAWLGRQIEVEPGTKPELVAITLRGSHEHEQATLLTTLLASYLEIHREEAAVFQGRQLDALVRRDQARSRLDATAARQKAGLTVHGVSDRDALVRKEKNTSLRRTRFQEQLRQVQLTLNGMRKERLSHRAYKPDSRARADEVPTDSKPLARVAAQLQERIGTLTREMATLQDALTEHDHLSSELRQQEQTVASLEKQLGKLRTESALLPSVRVEQPAATRRILGPGSMLALAGLPLIALCLGAVVAARAESRPWRTHVPEDLTARLGLPVLALVPPMRQPQRHRYHGIRPPEEVCGADFVAAMDALRARLLRPDHADACCAVLVTSAGVGEGKSTLACHFALSVARTGRKTLLIDADLRRPTAHHTFEQTLEPGLCELLLRQAGIADAVRRTTTAESLWIMPAGQCQSRLSGVLAPADLQRLLEPLREEFAVIVADAGPVLVDGNAQALGVHVDFALVSVLQGVSRGPQIGKACEALKSSRVRIAGVVLQGEAG
jgi:capsular exopolysaccharide synthesis family protein